ncbi:hypothetical protein [Streptomyces sp. NPDC127036]|uniref:hypothetical protein n=1 Tax=Streptomyces sp. NPDC127036 TaxID=3347112 RepID=UPI0036604ED1
MREIVQRTETVVRTRGAPGVGPDAAGAAAGAAYTLPEDAIEWIEALAALRRDAVTNPRVAPFREHVANACEKTLEALRSDAPGPDEASPGKS